MPIAPREAGRDSRFTQRLADTGTMPPEDDYREHTVEEFERYSTEMLAAETVALAATLTAHGVTTHALVTPLITHAEVDRAATAADAWALVGFWSDVLSR